MSPGPVEGMVGLRRWFRHRNGTPLAAAETSFGAALVARGWTEEQLDVIEHHLEETPGGLAPIFEVSEDMNWDEALALFEADR